MNWQKIALLSLLLVMSGCSTTYKNFKMSHIDVNESVAIGKVHVNYNGKPFNKECAICLRSIDGPCQGLTEEGYVFMAVKKGKSSVRRVVCKDSSPQHYNIADADYMQAEGVTYFGDVTIDWTNGGGFKVSSMFGLVGAIADESKNDGMLKMSVKPGNMAEVVSVFEAQTKTKITPVKNIAKEGR